MCLTEATRVPLLSLGTCYSWDILHMMMRIINFTNLYAHMHSKPWACMYSDIWMGAMEGYSCRAMFNTTVCFLMGFSLASIELVSIELDS